MRAAYLLLIKCSTEEIKIEGGWLGLVCAISWGEVIKLNRINGGETDSSGPVSLALVF